MSPQKSDFKFLLLMGFVVLLLGMQTFRDTFGEKMFERRSRTTASSRLPASLPSMAVQVPQKPLLDTSSTMVEWNWQCDGGSFSNEQKVTSQLLRFKGKDCLGVDRQSESVSLTNETNGFVASIFSKGKKAYETDLIQLREGPNRIRLEYVNSMGRKAELVFNVVSKISSGNSKR